jgi:hypothetical protein
MPSTLLQGSICEDHELKHVKIVAQFKVTGNATPASKKHSSDLPGTLLLKTEGKDDIVAVENITGLANYLSPSDAAGQFDLLVKASELGTIRKVLKLDVKQVSSTSFDAPTSVQYCGTSMGLTAAGNVAIAIDSATNLSGADCLMVLELDVLLSK